MKLGFIIFCLLLITNISFSQAFDKGILIGKWKAERYGRNFYYNFINDSLYNSWSDLNQDSFKISRYNIGIMNEHVDSIIGSNFHKLVFKNTKEYFRIIDKNHFSILIINYAEEEMIFHRIN